VKRELLHAQIAELADQERVLAAAVDEVELLRQPAGPAELSDHRPIQLQLVDFAAGVDVVGRIRIRAVVLYAPSNVLRGHNGPALDDGYLARFTLGPKSVEKVEVLPIIGKGQPEGHTGPYDSKLFQPALMQGADAHRLLENLRGRSAALDTTMAIDGEKGVIAISQTNK
jgi:hypothetical protein